MTKPQSSILRTCSICGLQKPLASFLQWGGPVGTTYSTVCADCRSAGLDKVKPKEHDESTRGSTGRTIDSKVRVQSEIDKRQERQESEEQSLEEKEEQESLSSEKTEKKENVAQQEKKHRESFLQQRTFLNTPKKTDTKPTTTAFQLNERAARQAHGVEQTTRQEHAAKAEQKEKDLDYASGPFIDTQISGKEKYTKGLAAKEGIVAKEGILAKEKGGLGKFANWAKAPEQNKQTPSNSGKTDEKILSEFIDKNMGPGSRRK